MYKSFLVEELDRLTELDHQICKMILRSQPVIEFFESDLIHSFVIVEDSMDLTYLLGKASLTELLDDVSFLPYLKSVDKRDQLITSYIKLELPGHFTNSSLNDPFLKKYCPTDTSF